MLILQFKLRFLKKKQKRKISLEGFEEGELKSKTVNLKHVMAGGEERCWIEVFIEGAKGEGNRREQ